VSLFHCKLTSPPPSLWPVHFPILTLLQTVVESQTCVRGLPALCLAGTECPTGVVPGFADGNETDVDCGGPGSEPLCPRCASGQRCTVDNDCALGLACGQFGTCVGRAAPPCPSRV
jgi:hypothetical protein